jgi:hypothetical protein
MRLVSIGYFLRRLSNAHLADGNSDEFERWLGRGWDSSFCGFGKSGEKVNEINGYCMPLALPTGVEPVFSD